MRTATVAISLALSAGCHVISRIDNTRPGAERITHHLDHPTPRRPQVQIGDAGVLRFVEPLECPTERTSEIQNSTEVITGPNIATFVVGMIATSFGAIALAKGSFDRDTPFIIAGAAGLAAGLPLTIGPRLDNTHELRAGAPSAAITTAGPSEPCGERPLAAKQASIAVHGLELNGTVDGKGRFSISPFSVIDAYQVEKLSPWDAIITIDHQAPFTQLVPGGDLAIHAFEFLQHLDVDGAIAPMHLVPGIVPGLLRVSLTSNSSGPMLRIVLSLGNDGPGDATAVRGQIAAQSSMLDSRMLYIGAIKKGATVTRELLLPITPALAAALRDDPLDLSIELRDGHGTAPTAPVKFRGVVMAEAPR